MTTMASHRKNLSVHDYPEHLNPFHEDDNHNKIRFWTIGRKLSRSNSITFKDLKNSWSLRSFMKKGKKKEPPASHSNNKEIKPVTQDSQVNGDASPVVFRRAMQYSSMSRSTAPVGTAERYVYGGSVTPLPRSRFQERIRKSQQDINTSNVTPRLARSDVMGSRLSMESTNPFDDECPVPPVRASRRKKKRAPLPPQAGADSNETIPQITVANESVELRITEPDDTMAPKTEADDDIDEMNIKIELKIVEDEDHNATVTAPNITEVAVTEISRDSSEINQESDKSYEIQHEFPDVDASASVVVKNAESESDILNKVAFSTIDIVKYRRNSSVNEDDIRLRRGNLEDFHSLSNKRSKSLTNTLDGSYVTYDINLNENTNVDINRNEEPQKVTCRVYEDVRKKSIDNSVSSTEKEFIEIDIATRELEREINKLNSALIEDDILNDRPSVSDIRRKFDSNDVTSPNPIPKPRRSHYGDSSINGSIQT